MPASSRVGSITPSYRRPGLPDLHVASSDIDDLVWDHLLVADLAGDIIVHVEPVARADLAASLVDLAQSGGPRNDAVVA